MIDAKKPKVAVCIPVYNGGKFLREAIASVLNQSLADFELIVVDDCSTDDSYTIASSFKDPRLTLLRNEKRLGLVPNWNRCITLSRAEYVCIFHQDDVMLPQNLQCRLEFFERNPSAGLVFSQAHVVDGEGNRLRAFWADEDERRSIFKGTDFFGQFFTRPNVICCPSVMVRKECYEKLGGFDNRLALACDCEMWMRICLFYDVGYIYEPLLKNREHGTNESRNFDDHASWLRENLLYRTILIDKFPERISESSELKRRIERDYSEQALSLANHHYSHGRYATARELLKFAAVTHRPIMKRDRFIRLSAKLMLGERGTRLISRTKHALQT